MERIRPHTRKLFRILRERETVIGDHQMELALLNKHAAGRGLTTRPLLANQRKDDPFTGCRFLKGLTHSGHKEVDLFQREYRTRRSRVIHKADSFLKQQSAEDGKEFFIPPNTRMIISWGCTAGFEKGVEPHKPGGVLFNDTTR